jgi:hypothetical protein
MLNTLLSVTHVLGRHFFPLEWHLAPSFFGSALHVPQLQNSCAAHSPSLLHFGAVEGARVERRTQMFSDEGREGIMRCRHESPARQ